MLGGFIAEVRDDIVLATKFSLGDSPGAGLQRTGNSRKAMLQSVEASLRRLRTDRIDLLWVHMPDGVTPVDEIARGLDDLVRSGKVVYTGLSDFPAWRVATAATLPNCAAGRRWRRCSWNTAWSNGPPSANCCRWRPASTSARWRGRRWAAACSPASTARAKPVASRAWGAVIHGESDARKTATLDAVLEVAQETGVAPGQVAIAWVLARGVLPIIGPRTPEQLADNLTAVDVVLAPEQIGRLEQASAIPPGFPHEMVAAAAPTLGGGKAGLIDRPARAVR